MKPNESQLKKIRKLGSAALPEVEAEDLEIHQFIATDNFVARSRRKWAIPALDTIAKMLPGLPLMVDHDWYSTKSIVGVVVETSIIKATEIPIDFFHPQNTEHNYKIYAEEGYHAVLATIAIPTGSQINQGLQIGAISFVSIGGFKPTDLIDPVTGLSFDDPANKFHPPYPYWDDDKYTAPYAIRADTSDMAELSLVPIPDVPRAKLITVELKGLFNVN
jgi:hypothetical protein